jgi:predicted dehydrogenase
MYLSGSRIRTVAAFTANVGGQPVTAEDSAVVTLRFEDGTLGTMTSGYYLDRGYHSMIKIWGTQGWLEMRRHTGPALEWSSGGRLHRVERAEGASGYTPFVQRIARACAGLEPAPLDADDSLMALKVVFAAYRSAETGAAVAVA